MDVSRAVIDSLISYWLVNTEITQDRLCDGMRGGFRTRRRYKVALTDDDTYGIIPLRSLIPHTNFCIRFCSPRFAGAQGQPRKTTPRCRACGT
jgi:hypothetical protein